MRRLFSTPQRKGFTIIELMVATAILAILASLTTIYFGTSRRNSRDARRKADVQILASAVTQYVVVAGNTFIKVSGQPCLLQNSETNPTIAGVGAGCVGASGRSYGKMNLKSPIGAPVTSDGYATNIGRVYAQSSINDALSSGGFLTASPQDPTALKTDITNKNALDYVLIRACTSSDPAFQGMQQVGSRGAVFGIWTTLENGPTAQEKASSAHYAGGSLAGPTGGAGQYVYDFAAQPSDWTSGAYYLNGFGVGNGQTRVLGMAGCTAGPHAS